MEYVTYRGENASLTLFGVRFEQKIPVLVEDENILKELQKLSGFEFNKEKVIPLEDLTLVQLKDKAKAAGIKGFTKMTEEELIKALRGE